MAMTETRQLDRTAAATTVPVAIVGPEVVAFVHSAVDADTAQRRRVVGESSIPSVAPRRALFSHRRPGLVPCRRRAMPLETLDAVEPFDPNPKRIP